MNQDFDYTPQNNQSSFQTNTYGMPPQPPQPPQPTGHAKGYAIASLCLGIASLFCCICCCCLYLLAPILSIISIVMAFLAKRDNGGKMSGMAIVGIILAILGLIFGLCILAFELVMVAMPEEELKALLDKACIENFGMTFDEYMELITSEEVLE